MLRPNRIAEYLELVLLFFVQGAALGMWFVPLSNVLDAYGFHSIRPLAFACSGIANFVSPLIFGAMADRHMSPVKVLRAVAVGAACIMTLVSIAIDHHASPWLLLALIQMQTLCTAPTWSVTSSIIFARLADPQKQFGPVRAMATLGWMAGCMIISLFNADTSTRATHIGAITWLIVVLFSFFVPAIEAPKAAANLTWRERLGLDALTLLKHRDHRVVFIITILFSIPLAAFYPFAPVHLREIGLQRTSAWMTLGQVTEIISMFSLGALLLNWRLKWIFAAGLAFGVTRFALSAVNHQAWLLLGILLHGASYTLVFITAQIYLNQRVDPAWRTRAQALLTVVNSGFGNLLGYLGTGWWFSICTKAQTTNWRVFWGGLSATSLIMLIYFLWAYHGRGAQKQKAV